MLKPDILKQRLCALIVVSVKYILGRHPEFYGLFNSVTKFIGISSLRRPKENYNALKHNLKSYNPILKNIRQAKIDYYANQFNQSKSNMRHTWSVVKEILNTYKNKREFPNYFVIDGQEINAHTDISNWFNRFSRVLALTLRTVSSLLVSKAFSYYFKQIYSHHLNLLALTYQKWEKQSMICHRKIAVDMTLYHQSSSNVFESLLKNYCA